jgi:hypothetical protein
MLQGELIRFIEDMSLKNRMLILRFLDTREIKIHESGEGSRINISVLYEKHRDVYDSLVTYANELDDNINLSNIID